MGVLGLAAAASAADAKAPPVGPVSILEQLIDPVHVQIEALPDPGVPITVVVPIAGEPYTLELLPHSVRSATYRVLAQVDDGSLVDVEPGPISTYRGVALEAPGSFVAASITPSGGLEGKIELPDVEGRYWITPTPGGAPGAHLLYHDDQVAESPGTCGFDERLHDLHDDDLVFDDTNAGQGGVAGETCYFFAQLAIDADFQYYTLWGSSTSNVENVINSVINLANDQYEQQIEISHAIETILIRTSNAADPYSSTTSPSSLLGQFRNHWNLNHGGIARDVAQMFTGRSLDDPVIGIAYTQNICTSSAYSLVQNISVPSCRADLSAHELGHNWSANHCNCSGNTMNSSLTCANSFHPTFTVPELISYRNARSFCLVNDCIPGNDDCGNATHVVDGQYAFTTEQTSTDGFSDNDCNVNGTNQIDNDIWFRYTAECDGEIAVSVCNSNFDTRLAIYQSFCPQTVNQALLCNDNACGTRSELSFQGQDNVEYLIRIGGTDGAMGSGLLNILGPSCITPPPNNNCGSATTLQQGVTAFTTIGATTDGPDEPLACTDGPGSLIEKDVWYRFLAPCTGTATLAVCDADFDTMIAVYGPSCPGQPDTALACNDNACDDQSVVSLQVNEGSIYRVRIGGHEGAAGSGTLSFMCGDDFLDCNENGVPDVEEIDSGAVEDCNINGVPDECDIEEGESVDENGNGVPDECEPRECFGDVDASGVVDVDDLVAVILAWQTADPDADVDGSGNVDVDDLVAVILAWGACPD